MVNKDLQRGVYSDTTQLNSTDPVEQRTAKSVVFLFMTSRPTNWVNWVTTFIDRWQLSRVELCRYKHPLTVGGPGLLNLLNLLLLRHCTYSPGISDVHKVALPVICGF